MSTFKLKINYNTFSQILSLSVDGIQSSLLCVNYGVDTLYQEQVNEYIPRLIETLTATTIDKYIAFEFTVNSEKMNMTGILNHSIVFFPYFLNEWISKYHAFLSKQHGGRAFFIRENNDKPFTVSPDPENSGVDLYCRDNITVPSGARSFTIDLGIYAESAPNRGYWLLPRSSLSKTPLRLANSVGLIDAGYRGSLMAKVDNLSNADYLIKGGTALFQLCLPTLENNIIIYQVPYLSTSQRGSGGFGSTNVKK
jgi:dUTP pyrophosphatase